MLDAILSVAQMVNGYTSASKQSKAAKDAAKKTEELTAIEANRQALEDKKAISSLGVSLGKAGMGASGTSQDLLLESLMNKELNYQAIKAEGEAKAVSQRQEARNIMAGAVSNIIGSVAKDYKSGVWQNDFSSGEE